VGGVIKGLSCLFQARIQVGVGQPDPHFLATPVFEMGSKPVFELVLTPVSARNLQKGA